MPVYEVTMIPLLFVLSAMANPNLDAGRQFLSEKLVDPAISSLQSIA